MVAVAQRHSRAGDLRVIAIGTAVAAGPRDAAAAATELHQGPRNLDQGSESLPAHF